MRIIRCKTKMTFLKITGTLLKETLVVVQFLHVLVSELQLCGAKLHCFYLILTVAIIKDFTIVMEKQRFWNNFLKTFFIENVSVSAETQYDLQCISVNVSDENKHQTLDSLGGRRRKSFYNRTCSESHTVDKEKKRKLFRKYRFY